MSQFVDMALYALALLAKFVAHITTNSQDRNLVSFRGFGLHNSEMQGIPVFSICEMPIPNFLRILDTRPR